LVTPDRENHAARRALRMSRAVLRLGRLIETAKTRCFHQTAEGEPKIVDHNETPPSKLPAGALVSIHTAYRNFWSMAANYIGIIA
jgi:hypothetical protein